MYQKVGGMVAKMHPKFKHYNKWVCYFTVLISVERFLQQILNRHMFLEVYVQEK